ncbi:MAG: lysostaphin resistance A-like protein [Myxococcota bacterium]
MLPPPPPPDSQSPVPRTVPLSELPPPVGPAPAYWPPQEDSDADLQQDGERGPEPRWGLGDVLLSIPIVLGAAAIVGIAATIALGGFEDGGALPLGAAALGLVAQQLAQGLWPVGVARWKGAGVVRDFGLRFSTHDLWIGPATAIAMLVVAGAFAAAMTELVELEDTAESSNTGFFTDAAGSPWQWVLAISVVAGAPLAEEIFFRGLVLRAAEKRWNTTAGVVISTVLFTLPHYAGAGWQGTIVLFTVIATVGAALAAVTVKTGRLGPAIVAHVCFNGIGLASTLAT